jgi:hypothetical protein
MPPIGGGDVCLTEILTDSARPCERRYGGTGGHTRGGRGRRWADPEAGAGRHVRAVPRERGWVPPLTGLYKTRSRSRNRSRNRSRQRLTPRAPALSGPGQKDPAPSPSVRPCPGSVRFPTCYG